MTHNELNAIAAKWCKRPASGNGPGCQVALTEVGGLYGGERADVFAYRWGLTAVRWWWSPRSAALIFWLTGQNPPQWRDNGHGHLPVLHLSGRVDRP